MGNIEFLHKLDEIETFEQRDLLKWPDCLNILFVIALYFGEKSLDE